MSVPLLSSSETPASTWPSGICFSLSLDILGGIGDRGSRDFELGAVGLGFFRFVAGRAVAGRAVAGGLGR